MGFFEPNLMKQNNQMGWLPSVIFAIGTLTFLFGVGFGIWFGLYGGLNEFAWPIVIGGAAFAVLLWGFSIIVKAALRYLDRTKE